MGQDSGLTGCLWLEVSYAKARVSSEGSTDRRESDSMWLLSSLCPVIDSAHSTVTAWQLASSTVSEATVLSNLILEEVAYHFYCFTFLFTHFIYLLFITVKSIHNFIYLFIYSWLHWVFVAAWDFLYPWQVGATL